MILLCDSDGSLRATCALLRHDFFAFILGRVIRTQPLPDTSMTIGEFQEDAHTWASDIEFEEINSTNPFSSSNSPHSLSDCDFATACTFYTTFNPCFHSSEQADENGLLPPILDTGATHCLLPLRWLTPDQAAFAKRIHLKVASGTSVRALLYNNLIYCKTVSRPLISVGQLKAMLDVRFIWSDSSPLLVACSGGLKYILVESAVIHHLPVISSHEMTVILEALHDFTSTGTLWNAATWSQHLGRKLALFHWSSPTQRLPPDHAEFTDDPQVMFSSMACDPSLEETPLLPSLQIFPLPSSSSSSSYRSFPAASSDALPSSSVITFNLEDHDPPTEDEEMTGKEGANHSSKDRTVKDEAATSTRDDSKRGSDSHSSSQSHLCHEKVGDRKETRSDRTDENFATNGTATSGMDNAFAPRNSKDRKVRFASHTTSHITELESVQSSVDILLQHKLPKARQRTNVVTQDYTPRGRLFGGYTTRGEGVTMASYRFPEVVSAIHSIAATRPSGFADEPYLSAQLNSAMSLPIHKDKNNHSMTWLIALGDFTGGRLWIESPVGTHPPPLPRNSVEKKLRGEYLDTKHTWICFDPQLYHAVEPVTSGVRVSLALFTPKGWKRLRPNCIDELIDIGFCPPLPTLSTHPSLCDVASSSDTHVATTSTLSGSVLQGLPTSLGSGQSTLPIPSGSGPLTLPNSSSSLSSTLPTSATDSVNNLDLATLLFGPTPSEAYSFTEPQQEEMDEIHGWCISDLVSLPSAPLPSSDGMISPLDPHELEELSDHLRSGHATKSNLCRGCLQSEGPRKIHRSIRDIDKATHTLHIDIAGPFAPSDDGYSYFLVGALRLPGFPLLIDVRTLTSRTSTEVCDELEKMVAYLEALQTEGLPIGETSRIKRLHSDRAGEFTAPFFARFLGNHKSIHHSFTSGYDPQSNGTAERSVGLIKSLASRALATAELDSSYWSYAVRYASQSLLCHALQKKQRSLPFGTTVVAQVLGHRDVKFPASRSITGRLLYFDHLNDQVSYILCPPGDDSIDPLVHRAGLPAKLPPAVNIDELAGPDPLPSSFDKLARSIL